MNECTTKSLELYEQKRKTPEHDYGWCFENDVFFDKLHQNSPIGPNEPQKLTAGHPKNPPEIPLETGYSSFPSPIIFRGPAVYVSGIFKV